MNVAHFFNVEGVNFLHGDWNIIFFRKGNLKKEPEQTPGMIRNSTSAGYMYILCRTLKKAYTNPVQRDSL